MLRHQYNKIQNKFRQTAKGTLSDHRIGISFALASFFAILPISVFAIAICLFLAVSFKYFSKLSMVFALFFWNPLWHAIFFYPAKRIGKFLLENHMDNIINLIATIPYAEKIIAFGIYYAAGMCVIAVYMSILSYFVIRLLIKMHRLRQIRKIQLQKKNASNSRNKSEA